MCFYSKKRQFFLLPLIALESDRCRENQVTKWSWGLWGYMLTESRNFWISYQSSVKQFGTLFASQTLLNTSPFLGMRQLCSITQFLFSHKKKIGQVHKFREKTTKKKKTSFWDTFLPTSFSCCILQLLELIPLSPTTATATTKQLQLQLQLKQKSEDIS